MSEDGARLNIKIFRFGDSPQHKLIEGRDIMDVVKEGEKFLEDLRRKYE